jgi:hypothetical protein
VKACIGHQETRPHSVTDPRDTLPKPGKKNPWGVKYFIGRWMERMAYTSVVILTQARVGGSAPETRRSLRFLPP